MKKVSLFLALTCVSVSMFLGQAAAQPNIVVPAGPPYTDFTVTGSDVVVFEFERDPAAGNTTFALVTPGPMPPTFPVLEKDGAPCLPDDSSGCSGSFVSPPPTVIGTFQIINISEAPMTSQFRVRSESGVGTWVANMAANAGFGFVHTIPDVQVAFPAWVPSGQAGVALDASASQPVFEGTPQPPTATPAIASYAWTQVSGPPVTITPSPGGDTATFDAPTVVVDTDVEIQVTVNDGLLEASETIVVNVRAPVLPVDAVLLVDTSGSMGWHRTGSVNDLTGGCCSRLASAKLAARNFVERLGTFAASSQVGVAIFPGEPSPSTVLARQFTPATGLAGSGSFASVITDIGQEIPMACGNCLAIPAPGSTTGIPVNWNGTPTRPGLEVARDMLTAASAAGTTTRTIILLSDGAWNAGSDPAEPAFLSDLDTTHGIKVYTIGMGTGTDNVNHASLQDISIGTGVGGPTNPIGFTSYEFGDPASEPNLIPHFEKILSDMVDLNFATDPSARIRPGETRTHTTLVHPSDRQVTFTVSWESSMKELIDFHVLSPVGERIPSTVSGNGYKSLTLGGDKLSDPANLGEWSIVVSYPVQRNNLRVSHLPTEDRFSLSQQAVSYNYSVVVDSELRLRTLLDQARYFTGDEMVVEARLINDNRRLPGAKVTLDVISPDQGIGDWHSTNGVSIDALQEAPLSVSEEPFSLLDRKNYVLTQERAVELPGRSAAPKMVLRDDGQRPDKQAHDGIYTGRFAGFDTAGTYKFKVVASGTTEDGSPFERETEIYEVVEVALDPEILVQAVEVVATGISPFFPKDLVDRLREPPPSGFVRSTVVFWPRDAAGRLRGPGYADQIRFKVENAELVGGTNDELAGNYSQVLEYPDGADPTVQITIAGVTTPPIAVEGSQQLTEAVKEMSPWLWGLLVLLLLLILVVFVWRLAR